MTLTEWLEAKIDVAAARHDADSSTFNVVEINQTMLAQVIHAVKIIDGRLTRIEAELGFNPFEIRR